MDKKTAIYLRVSTDGIKNGHSQTTDSQLTDIKAYLKSKNIESFEIYQDIGSGKKRDRVQLNKLLKDCKNKEVETVVCYKIDRLARSLKDLLEIVSLFQENDVEFISVKDSIDMSCATGRLLFQILGSFAEFEAATISERVLSGLASTKSKGTKLGRPVKNGHNVVSKLRKDGKTVKEISLHTGLSLASVYKTLEKEKSND
jgi:site-specific DNA recombinase